MFPKIVNIVSTVNINVNLDLNFIAKNSYDFEYDPKSFNGIVKRFRNPYSTILLFPKNKFVITGCTSETDSKRIAYKTKRMLHKLGIKAKLSNHEIKNIVATGRIEGLDIDNFVLLFESCFPDCHYKVQKNKSMCFVWREVKVSLFPNGKLNIVGAKEFTQIEKTYNDLINIITNKEKNFIV